MQKNCFNYPVEFVQDAFGASPVLAETLKKVTGLENPKILIVADLNVVQHNEGLGSKIGHYFQEHGLCLAGSPVVISGGEKVKTDNLQSVLKIVEALLAAHVGHNDVVLALGGGTILDIAGYAAAQVRGGVKLVRMPTTPTAMMGAAYATSAAVDFLTVKDALRVPSSPAAVVIDFAFATSVLDGVWRVGIGEAVRLGVAMDAALVKKVIAAAEAYRARDVAVLEEIARAVADVRRKKGDAPLGRWASARLESMSGYKLPYGYALSLGLCIDLGYAVECGSLKSGDYEKVFKALDVCGALDGRAHSGHILSQADNLLLGLDAWALSEENAEWIVLAGIGKTKRETQIDRDVFRLVIKKLLPASATA